MHTQFTHSLRGFATIDEHNSTTDYIRARSANLAYIQSTLFSRGSYQIPTNRLEYGKAKRDILLNGLQTTNTETFLVPFRLQTPERVQMSSSTTISINSLSPSTSHFSTPSDSRHYAIKTIINRQPNDLFRLNPLLNGDSSLSLRPVYQIASVHPVIASTNRRRRMYCGTKP